MKTIPRSLLDMLAQEWSPADPEIEESGGAFGSIFADRDRARDPSFYFASEGESEASSMLQFDEVAGLLRDGVLTSAAAAVRYRPSGARYAVTNEHAQHAIYDFCQAVYAGWDQLQQRLALIERASPRRADNNQPADAAAQVAQVAQVGVVTH
jgi:hypothetical protein